MILVDSNRFLKIWLLLNWLFFCNNQLSIFNFVIFPKDYLRKLIKLIVTKSIFWPQFKLKIDLSVEKKIIITSNTTLFVGVDFFFLLRCYKNFSSFLFLPDRFENVCNVRLHWNFLIELIKVATLICNFFKLDKQ